MGGDTDYGGGSGGANDSIDSGSGVGGSGGGGGYGDSFEPPPPPVPPANEILPSSSPKRWLPPPPPVPPANEILPPSPVPPISPYAEKERAKRGDITLGRKRATPAPGVTVGGATWDQVTGGKSSDDGETWGYGGAPDARGETAPYNPPSDGYYGFGEWDTDKKGVEETFGYQGAKDQANEMFVPGLVGLSETSGYFGFRDKARYDPDTGKFGVQTEWGLGNFIADALSTAVGFALGGVPGLIAGKVVGQIVNTAVDDDISTAQAVEGVFGTDTTRAPAPDALRDGFEGVGAFQTASGGVFGTQANAAAVPASLNPPPGEAPGLFDLSDDASSIPDTAGLVGVETGASAGSGLAGLMVMAAAALELSG